MAKRSKGVPQESGCIPPLPPEVSVRHRLAEDGEVVAYTEEEYGVRKDDGGGLLKPVNSSAGLLFLAVLITIASGGMLYGLVQIVITEQWAILGRTWWVFLACFFPFVVAWTGYFKERKAEKLRRAGNLPALLNSALGACRRRTFPSRPRRDVTDCALPVPKSKLYE